MMARVDITDVGQVDRCLLPLSRNKDPTKTDCGGAL